MMSMGRYLGRYLVNTEEYNGMRKRSERWKCQLNNVNGKGYIVEKVKRSLKWKVECQHNSVNVKVLQNKVDRGVRTGVEMVRRDYSTWNTVEGEVKKES